MVRFLPTYSNFQFLNGDIDSFIEDSNFIFVLMPFGRTKEEKSHFNSVFETIRNIVENACFHGGILKCSRADFEDNLIVMNDVCQKIKKANLTIFDISIPNTNVYYELGLACSLDKKILLTYNKNTYYESHYDEIIPFDINQFRYVEYQNMEELEPKLKIKIESLVRIHDFTKLDLLKVYQKVQKLTRHFDLDTLAEQIKEDWEISEYEIEKASDALDEYWNNEKYDTENYSDVDYMKLEMEIRSKIGTNNWRKVKAILRCLYWGGYYQSLIAQLKFLPAELWDVKEDFNNKLGKMKKIYNN